MKKLLFGLILCFAVAIAPAFVLVGCGNSSKKSATAGKKYTVTFVLDNAHKSVSLVKAGAKVKEPAQLTKAGYSFDAWYANAEKTEIYNFNNQVNGNMTLYARLYDSNVKIYTEKYYANAYVSGVKAGATSVVIPEIYNGKTVTSIGGCGKSDLQVVTIPKSITNIGSHAFENCKDLISVTIGSNVTEIGNSAFAGCTQLVNIIIPNNVTKIEDYAFSGCTQLKNVIISRNITKICYGMFKNCTSLTEFDVPNQVNYIGGAAFMGSGLTSFTLPSHVDYVGFQAFSKCDNLTELTLPYIGQKNEYLNAITLNTIMDYSTRQKLKTITIQSGEIIDNAFWGCAGLETINFPQGVTKIGARAFSSCSSLKEIAVPTTVTSLGWRAFTYCTSLEKITIPNSVSVDLSSISFYSSSGQWFVGCSNLKEAVLNMETIPFRMFSDDNGDGIDTITSLKTVVLGNNVKVIEEEAFWGCTGLETINFPEGLTKIEREAFRECSSLSGISFPSTLETVEDYAFSCSSVTEIVIPSTIKNIGQDAFGFGNLETMVFPTTNTNYSFTSYSKLKSITFSSGTTVRDWMFYCLQHLETVNLPSTITSIGQGAFGSCYSLVNITIPSGVTEIGERAFEYCRSLESVVIPEGVKRIGANAFDFCENLKEITIPSTITSIDNNAFSSCYNLALIENHSNLVFEAGPTNKDYSNYNGVGFYASRVYNKNDVVTGYITRENDLVYLVDGASKILVDYEGTDSNVVIPNDVTEIKCYAFYQNQNIEHVTIGNGVTRIGGWAFASCGNLYSVTIGSSVTNMENASFYSIYLALVENHSNIEMAAYSHIQTGQNEWSNICEEAAKVYNKNDAMTGSIVKTADCIYLVDGAEKILVKYFGDATEVEIPSDVTEIKSYAFGDFSIASNILHLVIPNGVKKIGQWAFSNCESLTTLTIPESVESIGDNAFNYVFATIIIDSAYVYAAGSGWVFGGKNVYIKKSIDDGTNTYFNDYFTKDSVSNPNYNIYTFGH